MTLVTLKVKSEIELTELLCSLELLVYLLSAFAACSLYVTCDVVALV